MKSSQSIPRTERFDLDFDLDLVIAGEVNKAQRIYYSQGICNLASYSMKDLRDRHIEELRATSQLGLDEFSADYQLRPLLIPLLEMTLNGEAFQNEYLKNVHEKISGIFKLRPLALDHQENNRDKIDFAAYFEAVSLISFRKIYQEYLGKDFHTAVVDEHHTMLASGSVLGEFVDESWDSEIKPKFICEQFIFPFLKGDEEGSNHSQFRGGLIALVEVSVAKKKPLIDVIAEVVKAIEMQGLFLEEKGRVEIAKQFEEVTPTNSGVDIFWSKSGFDFLNVATTPHTLSEDGGLQGMARCNVYDKLKEWLLSPASPDVSGSVMPLLKRLDTLNNFGLYHQTLIKRNDPPPCEKQEEEKAGEGAWCTGLTEEQKNSICDQLQSKLDKEDAGHEGCKRGEVDEVDEVDELDAERMIIDLCKKSEEYKIYFGFSFVQNNYSQWLTSYAPWQGIENIDGLAKLVEQYYCDCHTLSSNERIEKLDDMIASCEGGFPAEFNANVLTLLKKSLAEELGYLGYRALLDPSSLLDHNIDGPSVSREANDQELISEWYKPQFDKIYNQYYQAVNAYIQKAYGDEGCMDNPNQLTDVASKFPQDLTLKPVKECATNILNDDVYRQQGDLKYRVELIEQKKAKIETHVKLFSLVAELQLVLSEYLNKHNPDSLIQRFFHTNIDTAQQINEQLNNHVDSGELGLIEMIKFYKQICDLKDQAHSRSSMNSLRERVGARQESRWLPHKEGSELARGLNNISPAWETCIQSRVETLNTALSMRPALPDRPLKCAVDLETFMQEGKGVNNPQSILNYLFKYINPNVDSDGNKDENCNKHEIRLIIYPLLSNSQKLKLQTAFIANPGDPCQEATSDNGSLVVDNESTGDGGLIGARPRAMSTNSDLNLSSHNYSFFPDKPTCSSSAKSLPEEEGVTSHRNSC